MNRDWTFVRYMVGWRGGTTSCTLIITLFDRHILARLETIAYILFFILYSLFARMFTVSMLFDKGQVLKVLHCRRKIVS